jgi:hypothetical protein
MEGITISPTVTAKTIFVCRESFIFFLLALLDMFSLISYKTRNPKPPRMIIPIIIRLIQTSPLKDSRLLLKVENPALQKAEME